MKKIFKIVSILVVILITTNYLFITFHNNKVEDEFCALTPEEKIEDFEYIYTIL